MENKSYHIKWPANLAIHLSEFCQIRKNDRQNTLSTLNRMPYKRTSAEVFHTGLRPCTIFMCTLNIHDNYRYACVVNQNYNFYVSFIWLSQFEFFFLFSLQALNMGYAHVNQVKAKYFKSILYHTIIFISLKKIRFLQPRHQETQTISTHTVIHIYFFCISTIFYYSSLHVLFQNSVDWTNGHLLTFMHLKRN